MTIHATAKITPDGRLHVDIPCGLPEGTAEITIEVAPGTPEKKKACISDLAGLGREIWEGIDAQEYVNQLRDEWEEREEQWNWKREPNR